MTAWLLCRHKTLRSAVLAIRLDRKLAAQMPLDYLVSAQQALDNFRHALVFDPSSEPSLAPSCQTTVQEPLSACCCVIALVCWDLGPSQLSSTLQGLRAVGAYEAFSLRLPLGCIDACGLTWSLAMLTPAC